MISAFSTTCFVLAAAAFAAGGGYGLAAGDDQGGSAMFFFLGAAAALLGVAAASLAARDSAVAPSAAADLAPGRRPVDRLPAIPPSSWPLLGALALLLFGVGLATDAPILVIGVVASAAASIGWLAQIWSEHPGWNRGYDARIRDRYLVPFGLPLGTIGGIAIAAISVSRLLLAVPEEVAPLIAIVLAIGILGAFALLAAKPLAPAGAVALAVVGVLFVAASGVGGAVAGEREFHPHEAEEAPAEEKDSGEEATGGEKGADDGGKPVVVELVAKGIKFDLKEIEVAAGSLVTVKLTNQDQAVPHNVSFYASKGGKAVAASEIEPGPADTAVKLRAPDEGSFYFQCDVHPTMFGELVVT